MFEYDERTSRDRIRDRSGHIVVAYMKQSRRKRQGHPRLAERSTGPRRASLHSLSPSRERLTYACMYIYIREELYHEPPIDTKHPVVVVDVCAESAFFFFSLTNGNRARLSMKLATSRIAPMIALVLDPARLVRGTSESVTYDEYYVRRLDELKEWGKLSTMRRNLFVLWQKLGVKFITILKNILITATTIASMPKREWSFSRTDLFFFLQSEGFYLDKL